MIDFLANNIVWIIIGAIILVMAIIGYFAENSELGKKVMGTKEPKKTDKKKKLKPQPAEEIKPTMNNMGIASAAYATQPEQEQVNNNLTMENIETVGEVETPSDDAWTNNVDTNEEKPTEVVEANPNEWLNAPIDFTSSNEEVLETPEQTTQVETPTIEGSEDALYTMPGTSDVLPEVSDNTLPKEDFSNVEVLNINENDKNNDFSNVEVLEIDESEENPVEKALAQFSVDNEALPEANISVSEVSDTNAEDIWK